VKALYSAATGMAAQQTNLDNIANNISNVSTTGYKRSSASFQDLFYQEVGAGQGTAQVGSGVGLAGVGRSFTQGNLVQTGNTYDMALNGPGFFVVRTPEGQEQYTRDGSFKVNAEGALVTQTGLAVDPDINLSGYDLNTVQIQPDGTVVAVDEANRDVTLGQLRVVNFGNPAGLEAQGGNLYRVTDNSGDPEDILLGETTTVQQFALEGSNVDVGQELIDMIKTQRAFELASKVVQAADEVLSTAVNVRR
jgi:flagellar basal-body rod protein FlgG